MESIHIPFLSIQFHYIIVIKLFSMTKVLLSRQPQASGSDYVALDL